MRRWRNGGSNERWITLTPISKNHVLGGTLEGRRPQPDAFRRAIKVAAGQSPHAYVSSRKIERAKQLLRDGGLAIGQVAIELDFSCSAHFTQVFELRVGTRLATGADTLVFRPLNFADKVE
jgi:methylphosphotriester-DNA--protein-cysteine methyltransferase